MICSKCKKRPAVVFISKLENGKTVSEGLCLVCAKEMGIKPIDDIMQKMGISDDELDSISEQFSEFMGEPDENGNFSLGGAASFPFMQNISNFNELPENEGAKNDSIPQKEKEKTKEKEAKAAKTKYLDTYCMNLTQRAKEGALDRVIGREEEIYRVLQILNRRTKNNPCLIGEPGVGKTAIAEGLAIRIANKSAPAKLLDKEVYLLDLTALVAGTQFRGQFESRVKGLVEEVRKLGNIILVIDEVHNLVGAGDAEGSMNAANMLKPALSRGEIQVIGATTLAEYRKYIEKDAALERRFQPVIINEPTIDDTILIIKGVKDYYEKHHGVALPEGLIRQAVLMSERYVSDRFLPDKAIDLIDEACSNAALNNKAGNELFLVIKQLEAVNAKLDEFSSDTQRSSYEEIAKLKTELIRLESMKRDLEPKASGVNVTLADIARVIELWTGIPASKIKETEAERLNNLDKKIKEKIVGQDEAVKLVVAAVKRARANIVPRKRPVSFIFIGPTGVGKTEFVKVLSGLLFDAPETLIRLDMSEFMEKHSVSRIIGAPPGYVGYDEAGQLTEKIRRKPYSVILFDEIEKAHPDVLNILLQVLDEGKITDAHGKTVSFENTFIVMTSNAGSNLKGNASGFNRSPETLAKDKAMKSLQDFLRPEFLNRVDEIVVFNPLEKNRFTEIAEIMLNELKEGLEERETLLSWDKSVAEFIADKSYSPTLGARNVRRTVQKEVEDKIVEFVLNGINDLKTVHLTTENGNIKVNVL